ncbi:MAG: hypothetical protein CVV56_00330 [Tenericutes bacterium HGW-Tenericutes-1]|jgi:hypothetical protein|nr:MAG: hypothetical protein CVV56_00330 [Tenericutes bacterium HGW-Tenericutes-1]
MKFNKFKEILHEHARLPIEIDRSSFSDVLDEFEYVEVKPKFVFNKRVISLVMSFMILIAMSVTFTIFEFTPAKTLTIDLNPGFEVVLNRFNRVVQVNAIGDDADTMIDDIRFWHKSPEKVLSSIVDISVKKGYATVDDVTVLISVNTTDEVLLKKLTVQSDELNLKTMFMSINMTETVDYTSRLLTSTNFTSALESYKIYVPEIQEAIATDTTGSSPETFYDDLYSNTTVTSTNIVWSENLLVSLADYYDITLGKLQLVIAVFEAYDEYDTEAEFIALVESPISTLVDLYDNRP